MRKGMQKPKTYENERAGSLLDPNHSAISSVLGMVADTATNLTPSVFALKSQVKDD